MVRRITKESREQKQSINKKSTTRKKLRMNIPWMRPLLYAMSKREDVSLGLGLLGLGLCRLDTTSRKLLYWLNRP